MTDWDDSLKTRLNLIRFKKLKNKFIKLCIMRKFLRVVFDFSLIFKDFIL